MNFKNFFFFFVLVFSNSFLKGQRSFNYFSFGFSAGFSHYQGDLDGNGFNFWNFVETSKDRNVGNPLPLIRPAFGAMVNYHFHPYMFLRLNFSQGWIGADDKHDAIEARRIRNLNFESSITELSLQLVYEFFAADIDFRLHHSYRLPFTPYIFSGLGVFAFNPKSKPDPSWLTEYPGLFSSANQWVSLRNLGTEGQFLDDPNSLYPKPYNLVQLCIPIGMGFRFKLNPRMDLRFEAGLRKTFTDYLDDVSGAVNGTFYADPQALKAYDVKSYLFADRSPLRDGYATGRRRGARDQADWYGFTILAISYILDDPDRCAKFPGSMRYRKPKRFMR
jgi:hypothetical protein